MAKDRRFADYVVDELSGLGSVSTRSMFGGFGVFERDVMFGLIDRDSTLHFKADEHTRARYEDAGCTQFGRMPYFEVPAEVWESRREREMWAAEAMVVGHRTAAKKPATATRTKAAKKKAAAKKAPKKAAAKKAATKKAETKKAETKKAATKKAETKKAETKKAARKKAATKK